MIQKLRGRLTNGKKDNKGFTLVELIVVIVILAILAALLVPALIGWIDRAKDEKYAVEARNIYLATQAEISTAYAKSSADADSKPSSITASAPAGMLDSIKETSDLNVSEITGIGYDGATGKERTIIAMTVVFESIDGTTVNMTLANGQWIKN